MNQTIDTTGPVRASERIETVDILRGFALFGILIVNMAAFMHPGFLALLPVDPAMPAWDRLAYGMIVFLAQGKFISLFSLLFGLGVAIQFNRAQDRGRAVVPVYLRRLFVLFLIGCAHAFLLWSGDVLMVYAVAGLVLVFFRNTAMKTIWRWALGIFLAYLLLMSTGFVMMETELRDDPQAVEEYQAAAEEREAYYATETERAYEAYSSGSYLTTVTQRIREYSIMVGSLAGFVPHLIVMFLLGLLLGRSHFFEHVERHRPLLRRMLFWCALVGFTMSGISTLLTLAGYMSEAARPWFYVNIITSLLSYPALCLFYLSAITLLCQSDRWRYRLGFFAPVGRMSLSNYLLQSLICTLIFNGYGLGFYGQGGAAAGLVLSLFIYGAQVVFSKWWTQRFNYGPMEWLWRSLTYLRMQPMRRRVKLSDEDVAKKSTEIFAK